MSIKRTPKISIQNIVASVSLNQKIDLQKIVEKFPQTEYNPSVFPGLVFRLKKPKTATLIFGTGKMFFTVQIRKRISKRRRKSRQGLAQ
jgi:transcription initiation factor TFIID TATA-box-binding protein